jgi:DNA-binding winged helix-turn-helix (wHTH) protein
MDNGSRYQFGEFLIDVEEGGLWRQGERVPLTPKAFDVLAALLEQPGRVVSKDELLQKVWPDTFVEESNLAYNVFALRKALGETAGGGRYIETVPKRGYRLTAPVTPVDGGNGQGTASVMVPETPAAAVAPRDAGSDKVRTAPPSSWPRTRRVVLVAALLAALSYAGAQWWRGRRIAEPAAAVPLTSLPGTVRAPSLSPDGNYVVFAWNGPQQDNSDLYVQQVGAGPPLRLTHDSGNDGSPSWSPDGKTMQLKLVGARTDRLHTPELPAYDAFLDPSRCGAESDTTSSARRSTQPPIGTKKRSRNAIRLPLFSPVFLTAKVCVRASAGPSWRR